MNQILNFKIDSLSFTPEGSLDKGVMKVTLPNFQSGEFSFYAETGCSKIMTEIDNYSTPLTEESRAILQIPLITKNGVLLQF